jgi:flagellar biosynthesis protein FlhF
MKLHPFTAATARAALQLARTALGEDAMVFSNRPVEGGIELLVAAGSELNRLLQPTAPRVRLATTLSAAPSMEGLQNEMRSMRGLLETQLATLAWQGHQPEACAQVLRALLAAGFSAGLSRYIAEHMPHAARASSAQGSAWMHDIIGRNLSVPDNEDLLLEQGGVFALVGPTGVGKTTSTAKLAARCVARHGAASLALVTTDSYRIGAFEQLRIYGKILGVMVHAVRDAADLTLALGELSHKQTILIDTAGASQRDNMVAEQIAMLTAAGGKVKRLLCLNATSTAETLDEVVRAYGGGGLAGCLLTKLDEAVNFGGALDVMIRHKLSLTYIADGQRVPEDLHPALRAPLLERVFQSPEPGPVFGLSERELPIVAANSAAAMHDPLLREVSLG